MLRAVGVVCLLAGCDQAFGLAPVPDASFDHDEDHDGVDDAIDKCPHMKVDGDQIDSDGDGIGDPCDLGPEPDVAVFISFAHGIGSRLLVGSSVPDVADELVLGSATGGPQPVYVANLTAMAARIDVGFTFDGPTLPDASTYHEITFVTVNTGETTGDRGDVCFIGWDTNGPYLQANENTDNFREDRFTTGSLIGSDLGITMTRTPGAMTCDALLDGHYSGEVHVAPLMLAADSGRVGLWVDQAVARIHYLWIVTPR